VIFVDLGVGANLTEKGLPVVADGIVWQVRAADRGNEEAGAFLNQ
jgi:hypothetical protein